ncbi:MAG: hypothetical protein CFE26_10415, partial [Verrucomicrobiales bacterium VVV1]
MPINCLPSGSFHLFRALVDRRVGSLSPIRLNRMTSLCGCLLLLTAGTRAFAAEVPAGAEEFQSKIKPFFEANCVSCHGPKKSKGKVTLHTLDADLSNEGRMELWQSILDMVESGEMPPDDEPQPTDQTRADVVKWIESGLHQQTEKAQKSPTPALARRLTNFEYQNTMRDLLGIDLQLISGLP